MIKERIFCDFFLDIFAKNSLNLQSRKNSNFHSNRRNQYKLNLQDSTLNETRYKLIRYPLNRKKSPFSGPTLTLLNKSKREKFCQNQSFQDLKSHDPRERKVVNLTQNDNFFLRRRTHFEN